MKSGQLFGMKANSIIYWTIIGLLLIGISGAEGLVLDEIQTGNGCPKIGIVPVCIIILICFIVPLMAHMLRKWNLIYFLFTGLALSIATVASIMQFTGNGECPKTDGGMPMCYLSFLVFFILIMLKLIHLKRIFQ